MKHRILFAYSFILVILIFGYIMTDGEHTWLGDIGKGANNLGTLLLGITSVFTFFVAVIKLPIELDKYQREKETERRFQVNHKLADAAEEVSLACYDFIQAIRYITANFHHYTKEDESLTDEERYKLHVEGVEDKLLKFRKALLLADIYFNDTVNLALTEMWHRWITLNNNRIECFRLKKKNLTPDRRNDKNDKLDHFFYDNNHSDYLIERKNIITKELRPITQSFIKA